MPIIYVEMREGCSVEQHGQPVEVLIREFKRVCARGSADGIYVVIDEVRKKNWDAGGKLCSDKYPSAP